MAIPSKKSAKSEPAPVEAAEKSVVKPEAPAPKAAAESVKKAEKPAAPRARKTPAAKKEKAPSAPRKAAEPKVALSVQYQGRELSQEAMVAAVKAQWTGGAIQSLELYVKPEDGAVYYVVNGDPAAAGKVDF